MTRTDFSIAVEIPAPPPLVWAVMVEVERWPEWAASISRVKRLSPGPLQVGSRVRIDQPKLPRAFWRVTELRPGASFTWISRAPGVRVTARHTAEAIAIGTRVTLSIHYEGLLGTLVARWTGELNERYLALEADGLKSRCTGFVARLNCQCWSQAPWTEHLKRAHGGSAAGFHTELFKDFLHVLFHGGLCDAEDRRDVRVGLALSEPKQRFRRAGREAKRQQRFRGREIRFEFAISLKFGAAQASFDRIHEIFVGHGFRQIIVGSEVHAASQIVLVPFGGEENERN